MPPKLNAEIADLLASRIDSFEKLELVIALHDTPRSTLSLDDLVKAVGLPRETVRSAAFELRAVSLVELTSRGDVQLLPPTNRDHAAISELVRLYHQERITVMKAMGEIALDRIRNMASRAFVIHKKPPEDDNDGGA